MRECHIVTGPAAAGKSSHARDLAASIGACLIDSDTATERLVRAGLALAGMDPDDRDSAAYKRAFRDAVYEAMFDLAVANLPQVPVVLAGPFTREGGETDWPDRLAARLGVRPLLHFVWCEPEVRRLRMLARGEERDLPKLRNWEAYAASCREDRPVWAHHFVCSV
ncbi:MAG: ATP-binding protein [Verrucomicrobia bacterium]|nr:MAG: ATP-binding protein [Verrucomicrobiota bacterium]TAE87850.1 MAG: ATP-binding protein [Verrucomicrobiota bacterium]TAF25593.1 MAG: ATP-binding protein [Verrucomicrobiota bacterium]TAF41340.1 MAG: ATP-binding protein [Verrucomicrobiota bacterium]